MFRSGLFLVLLGLGSLGAAVQESQAPEAFRQRRLAAAVPGGKIESYSLSPDGKRFAHVVRTGSEERAFIDGKEVAVGTDIYPVRWSKDSRRWACIMKDAKGQRVVVDGVPGEYAEWASSLMLSDRGGRVAYVLGARRGSRAVVLDGVRQKEFDRVGQLAFSSDGSRFGYVGDRERSQVLIIDGIEKATGFGFYGLVFSSDGKRVAWEAKELRSEHVVIDGKKGKGYMRVSSPQFTSDGSQVAYEARTHEKAFLVLEDEEQPGVSPSSGFFKSCVAVGPGGRVAWRVNTRDGKNLLVVDGERKETPSFVVHLPITFSADGKRVAYVAREGGWAAVVDGKRYRKEEVILSSVIFSPDGRSTAYVARDKQHRRFVVLEGRIGPKVNDIRDLRFSAEGKHLGYVARIGTELWWKVLDVEKTVARAADVPPPPPRAPPPAAPGGKSASVDPLPEGARVRLGGIPVVHGHGVEQLAFSPDGKELATVARTQEVRIWNVQSGQRIQTLVSPTKGLGAVAFSPDGKWIATGGRDKTARLWDRKTGRERHVLPGHFGGVVKVAFSADSKRLLTATHGPDPRLWDVETGEELVQIRRHGNYVNEAALSPDGKTLRTCPRHGVSYTLYSWNAADGAPAGEVPKIASVMEKVRFSPQGTYLAARSDSFGREPKNKVRIINAGEGKEVTTIELKEKRPEEVAWSSDEKMIAVRIGYEGVSIRDVATGAEKGFVGAPRGSKLALSPDGSVLVTTFGGFVRFWNVSTGKEMVAPPHHAGMIHRVAYLPDGKTVVTGSGDRTVRLWEAATGKAVAQLRKHVRAVPSPRIHPDGSRLVTLDGERGVHLWDARTGKEVKALPVKFKSGAGPIAPYLMALSPDGNRAATYWSDRGTWLHQIDLSTGETVIEGTGKGVTSNRSISSMEFSPDGKYLVMGGRGPKGGLVVVWNAGTGQPWFHFDTPVQHFATCRYTPDGSLIVTAGGDGAVRFWDASTGKAVRATPPRRRSGVVTVAFSPDGRWMATGGYDQIVRFWNWKTVTQVDSDVKVTSNVRALAFSPDGKELAVGLYNATAFIMLLPPALTPGEKR